MQYTLARLVTLSRKHDHISPVLMELHRLPVEQSVGLMILLFTPKVVNGMAPVYLQDLLDLYRPCRSLRSGNMQLLKTQSYNLKSYGFRAFSICAPQLWNALPWELRVCHSVGSFRQTFFNMNICSSLVPKHKRQAHLYLKQLANEIFRSKFHFFQP